MSWIHATSWRRLVALVGIVLAALVGSAGQGPEVGVPYLTNYEPKNDNEAIGYQNWAVVEDGRGVVFVGNTSGVVEFDGVTWRLLPLPGRSTARSLARDEDGRIYVGGQGTFGFLAPDVSGQLRYLELSDSLPSEVRDFKDVWKTHVAPEGVYFQSFTHLFLWQDGDLQVLEPETSFHMSFLVKDTLYVRQEGVGLMARNGGGFKLVPGGEIFKDLRVYVMVELAEEQLLVGTREQGLFVFDGQDFTPFPTEADAYLNQAQLYHGAALADGSVALATLRGGVVLIDERGALVHILDRRLGLQDSTVTYVHADRRGGLWLALDRNLTRVEIPASFTVFGERNGLVGAVNSVDRFGGSIYAATTQGVYRLEPPAVTGEQLETVWSFKPVEGIATQSWDLVAYDDSVLAATNDGVYQIEGTVAHRVSDLHALTLLRSEVNPRRIYVGLLDGVVSLLESNGRWRQEGRVGHLEDEVRTLVEDSEGRLWVAGRYFGLHRFSWSAAGNEWLHEPQGKAAGLPERLSRTRVYRVGEDILLATDNGLYLYHPETFRFELAAELGEPFGRRDSWVSRVAGDGSGAVWLVSGPDTGVGCSRPTPDGGAEWYNGPFRRIAAGGVLEILPDVGGIVWMGTSNGLIRFDPTLPTPDLSSFQCLIRSVMAFPEQRSVYRGTMDGGSQEVLAASVIELPYSQNGLRFEFAAPWPGSQSGVEYSHRLVGFENGWAEWSREVKREYTNLSEGSYTFEVKARAPGQERSTVETFDVFINPPWHRTWWAYLMFTSLGTVLLFAFVRLQVHRVRRTERRDAENRRREYELHQARKVQRSMLPSCAPEMPGLDIAAKQYTATEVGGDYYDFFPQSDHRLYVAVGDATGHGLGAGLMVTATRTALLTVREPVLEVVASELNEVLRRVNLGARLNMALTLVELEREGDGSWKVIATGGGMPPIYLLRSSGGVEEQTVAGVPLGAMDDARYQRIRFRLEPGDVMVLMSDGLPERYCPERGPLGYDAVLAGLGSSVCCDSGACAEEILHQVTAIGESWGDSAPLVDDVTVVVVRVEGRA